MDEAEVSKLADSLIGQATTEQIEQWKADVQRKHGATAIVYQYEAEGRICYLRSVDRDTYSTAVSKVSTSPAKFNEVVINSVWLGGDETFKKVDQFYFGLIDFVEEMMAKKKGNLKAL